MPPAAPRRSEALTLLATLQREGRLVDFLMENIDAFDDAQVGAAVRDVHRACGATLRRLFAPAPAIPAAEGAAFTAAAGYDPERIRLTGRVTGQPPFQGAVAHPGWEATRCDLPAWNGNESAARIIAPAEIEIP